MTLEKVELIEVPEGVRILGTGFVECTQALRLCSLSFRRWPVGDPATTELSGIEIGSDGNPFVHVGLQMPSDPQRLHIAGARLYYRDSLRRHAADITIRFMIDVSDRDS